MNVSQPERFQYCQEYPADSQQRMLDMFIQVEQPVSATYMATIELADDGERAKNALARYEFLSLGRAA